MHSFTRFLMTETVEKTRCCDSYGEEKHYIPTLGRVQSVICDKESNIISMVEVNLTKW